MISFDDFQKTVREVEELQRQKDRGDGALAEMLARLKKEFGIATLKEAEKLLAKLHDEEVEQAEKFAEAHKRFKKVQAKNLESDNEE